MVEGMTAIRVGDGGLSDGGDSSHAVAAGHVLEDGQYPVEPGKVDFAFKKRYDLFRGNVASPGEWMLEGPGKRFGAEIAGIQPRLPE